MPWKIQEILMGKTFFVKIFFVLTASLEIIYCQVAFWKSFGVSINIQKLFGKREYRVNIDLLSLLMAFNMKSVYDV